MTVTRRTLLVSSSTAVAALGLPVTAIAARSNAKVVGLHADGLVSPLGLDNCKPHLGWRIEGDMAGRRQGAYRVLVATDPSRLAADTADLWNSGKISTDATVDIVYAGQPLSSRQRCYWRVEAWDDAGAPLTTSATDYWEMGLMSPADWQADWLEAEGKVAQADRAAGLKWIWGSTHQDKAPRRFRWSIKLIEKPVRAELLVAAREELRSLWLGGKSVGFQPFKKGPIDFWRMLTVPLELKVGQNVLGVEAAWVADRFPPSGGGAVAAVLRLTYADGREERRTTGPDWKTSIETSARWMEPTFDDGKWESALAAQVTPAGEPWPASPATLLRRQFKVSGKMKRARLYATALGANESLINGRTVGDALLAPETTDFRKRVLYCVHDVAALLKQGNNVLGAHVGDGWYASAWLLSSRYPFGPSPRRVCLQLEIDYVDGRREIVATDANWLMADSPVQSSEIYDGEVHDARLAQPGWAAPGFDDSSWIRAKRGAKPKALIVAQSTPPIRVTKSIKPVSVREVRPGVHVVDFGQNFSGWVHVKGKAKSGTRLSLRFAEILKADGSADQSNLRSAEAHDVYIFRGDASGESWRPSFTYHGFRYVEVSGWSGALPKDLLTGEVIHSDLAITGDFRTSDALIGQVWRNTFWGQRSNFVGIPTDCPQRDERLGWMGDAQIFWDAASFNMDTAAFTRRFTADVRDAQDDKGVFAEFAPRAWEATTMKGAPGWADAGIILPWTSWWRYGDTQIIDENWHAMVAWADYVASQNPNFLWQKARGSDYGDWLALDAKEPGDPTTPKDLVATAFWAHVTKKLAQMARATGRADAATLYEKRYGQIAEAFIKAFVKSDGTIGNGSQTGYILPLRFGLVPAPLRAKAAANLVADIRRRGTVLSTGFLGTPHALDVLADAGQIDLVYELLARTQFPSWGYMVAKGATTMWERWNSDVGDVAMNSFNHYALGAVVGFFYRRIAGIDAAEPAFKRITIQPTPGTRLVGASATYDSIAGRISSTWTRSADRLALDVVIPANCTASIMLPAKQGALILEGGRPIGERFAPKPGAKGEGVPGINVGSGTYRFEVLA